MAVEPVFLRAEDLCFTYPGAASTTGQSMVGWRSMFGTRSDPVSADNQDVLKNITFELKDGDRLALVGNNGSGKTPLLKMRAGGLPPTSGRVVSHGRLLSMLSPMLGINPEATGYENIFLKGLYLNQSFATTREKVDDIIAFSGLERAIHKPVRTFSAGMRARLSFAIVMHTEPEILLLDEWLGAGDRDFQKRAADRMTEFVDRAKITVLATHNDKLRTMVCNRTLRLKNGEIEELD